jgi:pimeloyl-ACP methyl ester carboxylesterase
MAYVEAGAGRPIVLLHGNPTSSYLWRSVLPALTGLGRCIVPDLIGMGDSDKLGPDDPVRYTFACHREFVDALLEVLGIGDVVLVVHDWGGALGFDWARRHRGRVRAIAYMEALVRPLAGWDEWPASARSIFQRLRSEVGEELILDRNVFVERILPASVLRPLTEQEMREYRRPFAAPGDGRLPTLIWPRQIPIAGQPAGQGGCAVITGAIGIGKSRLIRAGRPSAWPARARRRGPRRGSGKWAPRCRAPRASRRTSPSRGGRSWPSPPHKTGTRPPARRCQRVRGLW